jgi:hypothetical protein
VANELARFNEELVKALSAIVGELSREIVKTLQTLRGRRKLNTPVTHRVAVFS